MPTLPGSGGLRGRGASSDPANRFTEIALERDEPLEGGIPTRYLRDASRTVIATNRSPDIPFDASLNPYRGCEHGCLYCYARPTHEYLGFSAGLDFESRILVKEDAPELLRLPGAVAELFTAWLEEHYPDRKQKVLNRVRSLRDGQLTDPRFGRRMRGEGPFAEQVKTLFEVARRKHGLAARGPELSTAAFRRRSGPQLDLFAEL